MAHPNAVLTEDSLEEAIVDPSELLHTMPELRQYLFPAPPEDEIGLRALLERPDYALRAPARRPGKHRRRGSGAGRSLSLSRAA